MPPADPIGKESVANIRTFLFSLEIGPTRVYTALPATAYEELLTEKDKFTIGQSKTDMAYEALVQSMRDLYDGNITDHEAHDAARNLIAFFKTLLAMKAEQEQNLDHVQ